MIAPRFRNWVRGVSADLVGILGDDMVHHGKKLQGWAARQYQRLYREGSRG